MNLCEQITKNAIFNIVKLKYYKIKNAINRVKSIYSVFVILIINYYKNKKRVIINFKPLLLYLYKIIQPITK